MPRKKDSIDEAPHPVDVHVGQCVKNRRLLQGLSQEELATAIGVTFQQVQKYERGTNRISVSRLAEIANALKIPLDYFLEGCLNLVQGKKYTAKGFAEGKQAFLEDQPEMTRDSAELLRDYQAIPSAKLKKQARDIVKTLSQNATNE